MYIPRVNQIRLNNILYGWRANTYAVPLSTECRELSSPIAETDRTVLASTENGQFSVGGLALVYENPSKNALLQITSLTSSSIEVSQPVGESFSVSALIMPVKTAIFSSDPTRRSNGFQHDVSVDFRMSENRDILSSPSAVQYKNEDTYLDEQLASENFAPEVYSANTSLVDFGTGVFESSTDWLNTKPGRTILLEGRGLSEVWAIRQWLHRRAGRLRPVWVPTWEEDFVVTNASTVTNSLTVRNDGQLEFMGNRTNIAILIGGVFTLREVTLVSLAGNDIQLELDTALPNIAPSDIELVCYLDRKRLSSDRIELNWDSAFNASAQITLVNVE